MPRPFKTRKAAHGTQYRYRFEYTDSDDGGCPTFTWSCWAYNREDAEERFYDDEDQDWTIVSCRRVRESIRPVTA